MPLKLLDLPIEILELILRPLLVQADPVTLCPCGCLEQREVLVPRVGPLGGSLVEAIYHTLARCLVEPLPILLIHPAIYSIASRLFYQGNTFVLNLQGIHGVHVLNCLHDFSEGALSHAEASRSMVVAEGGNDNRKRIILEMRPALRRIRFLEIRIVDLQLWIEILALPLVKDMITSGSLTQLHVKLYAPRFRGVTLFGASEHSSGLSSFPPLDMDGSDASTAIFTRTPLAGLLDTIASPQLRIARLWVSGTVANDEAWRPFRIPHFVGARGGVEAGLSAVRDLVEIDWCSITRVLEFGFKRYYDYSVSIIIIENGQNKT
ncbi:hypothetical protein E4U57_003258 [Claviceps arundinis]|uniref:F-box domain-containing protein n=1 Tax=Claviceps arundinis TaxID=1623583 RepID=A0A9P7MR24_9HYPO|nr:hypothetical protein E4U57_003258 [Claviceps arundinis]KAG5966984.1 hypothetical protein E4U56_001011 [Claviceps arundinis]